MAKGASQVKNGIRKRTEPRELGPGQIPFARSSRRLKPPNMPSGEIELPPPPNLERPVPPHIATRLFPLIMVSATIGMMALMIANGGIKMLVAQPMMMTMPLMMLTSVFGMMFTNRGGGKGAGELEEERKDYFRHLGETREQVREIAEEQLAHLEWNHPDPGTLLALTGGRRMWERKPDHHDFGHARVGIGSQRLASKLIPPEVGHPDDLEPVTTSALSQFIQSQTVIYKLPTSLSLRAFSAIQFETPWEKNWGLLRAMLMQIALFHGPDNILISFIASNPELSEWSWAKWLPHCQHPLEDDALGARRLFFTSVEEWENSFYDDLNSRSAYSKTVPPQENRVHHLVILCDDTVTNKTGMLLTENGLDGVTVIDSTGFEGSEISWRNGLSLAILDDGWLAARSGQTLENFAQFDEQDILSARIFARSISRWRVGTAAQITSSAGVIPTRVDSSLTSVLKIRDVTKMTGANSWRYRTGRDRLRVPIGVDLEGNPVELDLKEGAEQGMGPHGVCIGATGSGKSEFLRTLVLSLIATHSPEQINMILVDFKGGATFLGFEKLRHVAAVITNLEDEADLVERMADALSGEMNRRQNKLRDAGNYANVTDYNKDRMKGKPLDPFPALFIIVDEFTELLTQFPDFGNLFDAIGRLGRSLHVHMLLASQRLSGMSTDKIITNLSYRVALKTFTASDSQSIIGTRDAYSLPNQPGAGYMRINSADQGEMLIRFNSFYVSGAYTPPKGGGSTTILEDGSYDYDSENSPVNFFIAGKKALPDAPPPQESKKEADTQAAPDPDARELYRVMIDALAGQGLEAHEVWLPPLYYPPAVDTLAGRMASGPAEVAQLTVPVGIIDRPYYQRQDLMNVDLNTHIGFIGAPQTGKSTAVRTMILSAAVLNTPEQVQFYCLDFGGGSLNSIANLPHVGAVSGRLDVDAVRRTIAELQTVVKERELLFRDLRIDSMSEYRRRKAEELAQGLDTRLTRDKFGDVYLVIDGFAAFKQEFEQAADDLDFLVNAGLSFGVHFIITTGRWNDIKSSIREKLLSRFELRIGDPIDSELDSRGARRIPQNRPGRGMILEVNSDGSKKTFDILVGVPRLDGITSAGPDLPKALADSVEYVRSMYPGREAPAVRMLPARIDRMEILAQAKATGWVPKPHEVLIGVNEASLSPVILDFESSPLFLGFAAGESGKTTLIRNIAHGLVENGTPEENQIILFDYRRTMLGEITSEHSKAYISSVMQAGPVISELVEILNSRIPPADVTQKQLRERSWWTGPDYYVIADDYDVVSLGGFSGSPLEPLAEFVPMAKDVGLRIIIMRRSGGAFRASMEPLLKIMKEVSTDGIMMNGDKDEDAILGAGVKMSVQPPGRGTLVSRRLGVQFMQVADFPPPNEL